MHGCFFFVHCLRRRGASKRRRQAMRKLFLALLIALATVLLSAFDAE